MKRTSLLEDAKLGPGALRSRLADIVEPLGLFFVTLFRPVLFDALLQVVGTAQGGLERGGRQPKLIANGLGPDGSSTARGNSTPPHVASSTLTNGVDPARDDVLLPEVHQSLGVVVAVCRSGSSGGFTALIGLDAGCHHFLVLFDMATLLGRVFGRQP